MRLRLFPFAVAATISVAAIGCSNAKPDPPVVTPKIVETTATLQQQKMCAQQAKVSFDEFDKAPTRGLKIMTISSSYTNHFDANTTTCYVEIFYSFSMDGGKTMTTSKVVSDAFEGRTYASYMWTSDRVKKYWEVKPTLCTVTPRNQDEIICQSDTEFDSLVLTHFGTGE